MIESQIYTDPSRLPNEKLNAPDQEIVRELSTLIGQSISKSANTEDGSSALVWSIDVVKILGSQFKQILYANNSNMNNADSSMPEDNIQLCLTGSYAKNTATRFSKPDIFIIVRNRNDIRAAKNAAQKLLHVCQRIGLPIDDTTLLCDTVTGLTKKNIKENLGAKAAFEEAIPIGNDGELLKVLQFNLRIKTVPKRIVAIEKHYRDAVEMYPGPENATEINIKNDILMPIETIIAALKLEFDISSEDSDCLNIPKSINKLLAIKAINSLAASIILATYQDAVELRFRHHHVTGNATDILQITAENATAIRKLLDQVAILRGAASIRLQHYQFDVQLDPRINSIPFCVKQGHYVTETHAQTSAVFDLTEHAAKQIKDPAEAYFFSQREILAKNLAMYKNSAASGLWTRVFNDLPSPEYIKKIFLDELFRLEAVKDSAVIVEKAQKWIKTVTQRIVSDLFDIDGHLKASLYALLNATGRLEKDYAEYGEDKINKCLLSSYLTNLISPMIGEDPRIQEIIQHFTGDLEDSPYYILSSLLNQFAENTKENSNISIHNFLSNYHDALKILHLTLEKFTSQLRKFIIQNIRARKMTRQETENILKIFGNINDAIQQPDSLLGLLQAVQYELKTGKIISGNTYYKYAEQLREKFLHACQMFSAESYIGKKLAPMQQIAKKLALPETETISTIAPADALHQAAAINVL